MAHLTQHQIRQHAAQIIAQSPAGIRYTDLIKQVKNAHPQTPINTISGAVWNLDKLQPNSITKPSKGLYMPVTATNQPLPPISSNGSVPGIVGGTPNPIAPTPLQEQQFYQPFADYLKGELSEVTVAEALGGAGLGKKWGTPDVVGVYKPLASDRIKFELEIVSGEIKIDPQESVTAFGQAIAYRLFSTKVYVVMPSTLPKEDQNRLEALCMLFGVGFVVFDLDLNNPNFSTRVRAQRFAPDMFYVNVFADQLFKHNITLFQKLF